ncbi:MAG TPA: hypothetical protein VGW74_09755 [Propionibacteriaceae bacterium]|nr:hypothetical protein [Propionibacteriaceae bacterium]
MASPLCPRAREDPRDSLAAGQLAGTAGGGDHQARRAVRLVGLGAVGHDAARIEGVNTRTPQGKGVLTKPLVVVG